MGPSKRSPEGSPKVRSLRIGEVELTLVPDGDPFALPGEEAYGVPASAGWGEYTPPDRDGLPPGRGVIRVMPYSLLVRRPGGTFDRLSAAVLSARRGGQASKFTRQGGGGGVALVDTGGENPAESPGRRSDFLEQLASLGVRREDVATVVITHAHLDHIGYNTVVQVEDEGGRPVPTFPNATYFIQKAEADPVRALAPGSWRRYFGPIEDAGRLREIEGDEEVAPGITCLATPGHTMGHQSVVIDCGGGRAAIYTGDLAVTKLHLEKLDWSCTWTQSFEAERESKRKVIDLALETDALLIFGHDPRTSWGRLVREGDGVRVVPW